MYVRCKLIFYTEYGDIKIKGGGDSGTLEFQQNDGTWGTVCVDGFDANAATVACKQLGYDGGSYYSDQL